MKALSALQRRMWFLCTEYQGTSSPIVVISWRIRGVLDVARFVRAVGEVVNRHDNLRSVFTVQGGVPYRVPGQRIETELIEARDAGPLVAQQSTALLDLFRGPLVASRLIRVGPDDHVWCFTMHHLLADGGSAAIVGEEVVALYRGQALPSAPEFSPEENADDLAWWIARLTDVPALRLPTDLPRPPQKGTRSAGHDLFLDLALAQGLERLAREQRCTPFMILLTGYAILLAEITEQDDFCVGIPVDGRDTVDAERAVGLLANTLALRLNTRHGPTFRELLAATRAVTIDALSRQSVPFGQIVAALDLPRDSGQTQLVQTVFCLHTEASQRADVSGLAIEPFGAGHPQTLHDLVLDLWRKDDGIVAAFRYDSALFKPDSIADLAHRYEQVLRAAVADPEAPV